MLFGIKPSENRTQTHLLIQDKSICLINFGLARIKIVIIKEDDRVEMYNPAERQLLCHKPRSLIQTCVCGKKKLTVCLFFSLYIISYSRKKIYDIIVNSPCIAYILHQHSLI